MHNTDLGRDFYRYAGDFILFFTCRYAKQEEHGESGGRGGSIFSNIKIWIAYMLIGFVYFGNSLRKDLGESFQTKEA